jgi:hypothetical protein
MLISEILLCALFPKQYAASILWAACHTEGSSWAHQDAITEYAVNLEQSSKYDITALKVLEN